jgi:hypothetical protein
MRISLGVLLLLSFVAVQQESLGDPSVQLVVETITAGDSRALPGVEVFVSSDGKPEMYAITGPSGNVGFAVDPHCSYRITARFSGGRTEITETVLDDDSVTVRVAISMYERVSIIDLIANKSQWDGRAVMVVGFLEVDSEETALYLHREDWKWNMGENAVWLGGDLESLLPLLSPHRRRYVSVWGTFQAGLTGHLGSYSGGLTRLERVTELSAR